MLIFTLFMLWLLGFVRLGGIILPDAYLFTINNTQVSLWNVLVLLIVLWVIGMLPSPFAEIASVFLLLWILAILGVLAISGLPNLLLFAMILGLVVYLFSWRSPA